MSGFHNCRECITEVACEKAGRCFNGSSASGLPETAAPLGSLCCDAMVGGRDEVIEAGADKGKTAGQLHDEVFNPAMSDMDYFLSRCRHHGIKAPNVEISHARERTKET